MVQVECFDFGDGFVVCCDVQVDFFFEVLLKVCEGWCVFVECFCGLVEKDDEICDYSGCCCLFVGICYCVLWDCFVLEFKGCVFLVFYFGDCFVVGGWLYVVGGLVVCLEMFWQIVERFIGDGMNFWFLCFCN